VASGYKNPSYFLHGSVRVHQVLKDLGHKDQVKGLIWEWERSLTGHDLMGFDSTFNAPFNRKCRDIRANNLGTHALGKLSSNRPIAAPKV
jgi:hypothetical protein